MKRLLFIAALASAGCYSQETPGGSGPGSLGSFRVEVTGVKSLDGQPLPVVLSCSARYGSDSLVPASARGTPDCRYAIPHGQVSLELAITALDATNKPLDSFSGPVSYRVVPGDLPGAYETRWTTLTSGKGSGTVIAAHIYGETRVWVEDQPPQVDYLDGGVADAGVLPVEPEHRTYATGLSGSLFFDEPSLARIQEPDSLTDNSNSPFASHFLTIGRAPETGAPLAQNCPPLPALPGGVPYAFQNPDARSDMDGGVPDPGNGQLQTMVITGADPSGFFVTDLTACKAREVIPASNAAFTVPEPENLLPGTFGSMYVYNYSFPEGLDPGDLLWTISGSVQDFTGTTQLTFPAWTVREHVRRLPQSEWNKYLDLVKPTEINLRICGLGTDPYGTDGLCAYSYGSMKIESLESALVKLKNVRFPTVFKSCDLNGDGTVTSFCTKSGNWVACGDETANDTAERQCNVECVTGSGSMAGKVCAERTTFNGFGQFPVEMAGPGRAEVLLDNSLPSRLSNVSVASGKGSSNPLVTGAQLRIMCETPVRVKFGPRGTVAAATDTALPAYTRLEHTLTGNESVVAFLLDGPKTGDFCTVSVNTRTRINVLTRDAIPDLVVDCSEADADATRAQQCRNVHGATFDVVGHLRQVTAARPRWQVMPRDVDDVCCRPGPGLECPKPIKTCPAQ